MTIIYPDHDGGIETTAPFRRRVGHEVEIDDDHTFMRYLWDSGLGTPAIEDYYGNDSPHPKGCDCDDAREYLLHTTDDCSAPGHEHLIGGPDGVLYASPTYMEAIAAVAEVAEITGSTGSNRTGGHIHVSKEGMEISDVFRTLRNAATLWDQLLALAAGPWDEVRDNQHMRAKSFHVQKLQPKGESYGSWGERVRLDPEDCNPEDVQEIDYIQGAPFIVGRDGKDTVEWRIWNTMTSKWRLYTTAGVAAAMMEAGLEGREAEHGQDLLDFLDGLVTPDLIALVERQRAILSGDMSWAA